ncbi:heterokaryon incompatibility protein-domain-containing protein [Rhexocercosporidium sp. MPI-PUGE-AT-0058]|nr:heterokaryon incompatibility protein-domain-containing protein [Rhexocercosporidium sp. MPI-PUGE-AT-0058]
MANTPSNHILYPYLPLHRTNHVRLLCLLPAARPMRIECQLVPASLERSSNCYEALSYAWGKSEDQHRRYPIWIDDVQVWVQENLYHALLALRKVNQTRILWVDAICVNQLDIEERGSQIQQMCGIYGQAERVITWVGLDSDGGSLLAMSFVEKIYEEVFPDGPDNDAEMRKYPMHRLTNDPTNKCKWEALAHFCNRRYWTRRWIIQEIALASRCVIQCGDKTLDWDKFQAVCLEIVRPSDLRNEFAAGVQLVTSIGQSLAVTYAKLRSQRTKVHSLQFLLEAFEQARCKEPKDKIFAILGLIDHSSRETLVADYKKSLFELWVDVVWFMLPDYESKTPLGRRYLEFPKSIVRISQCVQRNLGDVSRDIERDVLEALSASLPVSRSVAPGVTLIQGLMGGTITHLHPYSEHLSATEVADEFRGLPSYHYRPNRTLRRTAILQQGLTTIDDADKQRVLSFSSRISYGMMSWDPLPYEARDEAQVSDGGILAGAHGRHPIRRNSLEVQRPGNMQLFLSKSGMMGLVPSETKAGDMICHFLNCDVAAVIRREGDKFLFVGRALVFIREGSCGMRLNDETNQNFKYFVPNEEEFPARMNGMSFYVDVATLQLLTR